MKKNRTKCCYKEKINHYHSIKRFKESHQVENEMILTSLTKVGIYNDDARERRDGGKNFKQGSKKSIVYGILNHNAYTPKI